MSLSIEEIQNIFGKFAYTELGNGLIKIDHNWIKNNLIMHEFSGIGLLYCHKKVLPQLSNIFKEIKDNGLSNLITLERGGGCFCPRHSGWNQHGKLSSHCFGIAVELNVPYNKYGVISTNTLSFNRNKETGRIIESFEKYGFEWGDERHPAHFEWIRFV